MICDHVTRGARVFIWVGGALFVASLATCAYHYLIVWAQPHPPALWNMRDHQDTAAGREIPLAAIAADLLLLTLFALHHSAFARDPVKTAVARLVPAPLARSFYVWVASLLLIAVCVCWQPIGGDVYDDSVGLRPYGHALVQLLGLWITARGVARIDPLELAGIRPASQSPGLQVTGPYRWVRHPLYFGWLLMFFGAAHMTRDRLLFATITTLYLVVAIPWEERSLLRSFGGEYARYMRDVKWRMIPFIY
jgi:protein-S-isoprenylcysteine O-methyltransferase Ste14